MDSFPGNNNDNNSNDNNDDHTSKHNDNTSINEDPDVDSFPGRGSRRCAPPEGSVWREVLHLAIAITMTMTSSITVFIFYYFTIIYSRDLGRRHPPPRRQHGVDPLGQIRAQPGGSVILYYNMLYCAIV